VIAVFFMSSVFKIPYLLIPPPLPPLLLLKLLPPPAEPDEPLLKLELLPADRLYVCDDELLW
jgi:hypothetical protein